MEHLDFVIYPKPANGTFWLTAPLGSQIEVINILGQKIEHRTAEQTKERFVINKTGVYIVILRQGKSVSTERVIIR